MKTKIRTKSEFKRLSKEFKTEEDLFNRLYGRILSEEEKSEIRNNLCNYIKILIEIDRGKDKK